jgi:hypothetical protein
MAFSYAIALKLPTTRNGAPTVEPDFCNPHVCGFDKLYLRDMDAFAWAISAFQADAMLTNDVTAYSIM